MQSKVIGYIQQEVPPHNNPAVLDVGCGNGAFLLEMLSKGYFSLTGIDYAESAIRFVQLKMEKLQEANPLFRAISLKHGDIINPGAEEEAKETEKYDIVHDKGTFDVIHMNKGIENRAYVDAIARRLKKEKGRFAVITSCNLTGKELEREFCEGEDAPFELKEELKGYPSFTFGGV